MNVKLPIGASACLIGHNVRFNGGHARSTIVSRLGEWFDYVPVCPEMAAGLGAPRPTVRMQATDKGVRVVDSRSGVDRTDVITDASARLAGHAATQRLRGFVLKRASPSCGMERVKVYRGGMPSRDGVGVFAGLLAEALPNLPVEEEGRLTDPRLGENFLTRVFTYDRWLTQVEAGLTARDLVAFHREHKYLVLAHAPSQAGLLGRLAARAGAGDLPGIAVEYEAVMMAALRRLPTRSNHLNVLQHLAGFVKQHLTVSEKHQLHTSFDEYMAGILPLEAALVMLRHFLERDEGGWSRSQQYLQPYPRRLALRSSVVS